MSRYTENDFNTTDLVLNVMGRVSDSLGLDLNDDKVSTSLYWVCCDLESWEDSFGSSDMYGYVKEAREVFNLPEGVDA
tara:strand:+ start:5614 stop:5847 length:234 start_codon:yes stop_codon:yes gene_type:complete